MVDSRDAEIIRSSLKLPCKIIALIFGPLFVVGPVVGAVLFLTFQPGEWATYVLSPFFVFFAGLCAYLMSDTNSWIELDGDTIRARNFWTGRVTTRQIPEVRDVSPPHAPAFAIWFHEGKRLAVVRKDMANSGEFARAVTAKMLGHRRATTPALRPPADAELTFELGDQLVSYAVSRRFMRTTGWGLLLGVLVSAAGFAALLALGCMSSLLPFLVPGILLALFPLAYLSLRRSAVAALRHLQERRCTVRFDEEGVSTETSLGSSQGKWKAVSKLWRFPGAWLLVWANGTMNVLPPACMSPELRAFIVREVELNGGRVE